MAERVYLREVGLRDGLQLATTKLDTARKLEWCRAEAAAGVPEIEVTSFVPPSRLPQFADAPEVAAAAVQISAICASALVPNLKGAIRALDAGLKKINYIISASEAHSRANVGRTTDEALDEFHRIVAECDARERSAPVRVSCAIATAFGCSIQGDVPETRVLQLVGALAGGGADEVMIADTVGYANPNQVRRMFSRAVSIVGSVPLAAHFHDTFGLGLANISAAAEVGVRRFDASLGGLGGCPHAPGASGNVNMEDSVFLLESSGFDTGVDLPALCALRRQLQTWLPHEHLGGAIARSGLPKNFRRAGASDLPI